MLLSHNNSFASEAFIVIGDEILINFVGRKKNGFRLKIFYFSICLTSNKFYWIEDQLADVSTRFYMSASWRWRVEPSATCTVGDLIVIHLIVTVEFTPF